MHADPAVRAVPLLQRLEQLRGELQKQETRRGRLAELAANSAQAGDSLEARLERVAQFQVNFMRACVCGGGRGWGDGRTLSTQYAQRISFLGFLASRPSQHAKRKRGVLPTHARVQARAAAHAAAVSISGHATPHAPPTLARLLCAQRKRALQAACS